jgi:hypothetical protein
VIDFETPSLPPKNGHGKPTRRTQAFLHPALALLWHIFEGSGVFGIPGTRVA